MSVDVLNVALRCILMCIENSLPLVMNVPKC